MLFVSFDFRTCSVRIDKFSGFFPSLSTLIRLQPKLNALEGENLFVESADKTGIGSSFVFGFKCDNCGFVFLQILAILVLVIVLVPAARLFLNRKCWQFIKKDRANRYSDSRCARIMEARRSAGNPITMY